MKNRPLYILILLICLQSCNQIQNNKPENKSQITDSMDRHHLIDPKNIEFTYEFDEDLPRKKGETITLKCSIKNKFRDTIYYVAQSCFGWESTFIYDPSLVEHLPTAACNTSFPQIHKLAPSEEFNFKTKFIVKSEKLQDFSPVYYIQQVDQKFDLKSYHPEDNLILSILKNARNAK